MKIISRAITATLSAGLFATLFVSQASAGCGDLTNWQGSFAFAQPSLDTGSAAPAAQPRIASARGSLAGASIAGLWKVQFVSLGNVSHNPSIPDGAIIDYGYNQWHADGTEFLNSGMHAPATQNFCLGVWGQTGYLTFELNHFALSYDAISGLVNANVNIREQITLSPSGDSFTGTFTIDVFTPNGTHADHLAGTVNGQRLTVDSTLP